MQQPGYEITLDLLIMALCKRAWPMTCRPFASPPEIVVRPSALASRLSNGIGHHYARCSYRRKLSCQTPKLKAGS
eukprot:74806-Pleurochrysis_carterae.AAC.1